MGIENENNVMDLVNNYVFFLEKYIGKTIDQVPQVEITKYDKLQKELNKTLTQKTLAKSPEGVIKTDIGEKGLESQL